MRKNSGFFLPRKKIRIVELDFLSSPNSKISAPEILKYWMQIKRMSAILGTCQCGQCLCDKGGPELARFYGQFCECDDLSCLRGPSNDLLCSGNGNCRCGLCKCNLNWKGEDCGCSKSTDQCIWPYNQGDLS